VTENAGLKVLATVLAVILWSYVRIAVGGVTQKVMSQLVLQIPLETRGAGTNLIPYEKSADTITVTLRGESAVVSDLRQGLVRAYVDVADMVSGSHWPEVQVLVPPGVQILGIEPKSVNVKLSAPMFKEVPVLVEATGEPKAGFKVRRPTFSPKTVRLQGPEALVSQVEKVTCLVPVGGLNESFTESLHNLTPVNDNGNAVMGIDSSIRMTPRKITATIPIVATETIHTLPVILNNVKVEEKAGFSYDIEVEPQFVQVRTQIQDPNKLPDGVATEDVRFAASSEVQEREVSLSHVEGITTMGTQKVKLRLVPRKKPPSGGPETGADSEEVST
jgi:YbbR domain-containing protein